MIEMYNLQHLKKKNKLNNTEKREEYCKIEVT